MEIAPSRKIVHKTFNNSNYSVAGTIFKPSKIRKRSDLLEWIID